MSANDQSRRYSIVSIQLLKEIVQELASSEEELCQPMTSLKPLKIIQYQKVISTEIKCCNFVVTYSIQC